MLDAMLRALALLLALLALPALAEYPQARTWFPEAERFGEFQGEPRAALTAYDRVLDGLSEALQGLKSQAPQTTRATLLLEPQVAYEQVVQIMDAVRVVQVSRDGGREQAELFPDIAIGDAPLARRGS